MRIASAHQTNEFFDRRLQFAKKGIPSALFGYSAAYLTAKSSCKLWETVETKALSVLVTDSTGLTFSDKGLRPFISNWTEIANPLLLRLQREVSDDPQNTFLINLLEEAQKLANVQDYTAADISATVAPVMSLNLQLGDVELKMFSMMSSFGTALDVTASELKVETFFPADEATSEFFRA